MLSSIRCSSSSACRRASSGAREIFAAWSREKDLTRFSEFLPTTERDRFLVEVPRRIVMTYGGVALLRRIPLVCLPLNVSLDYTLVSSTGLAARHFFDDLSYDHAELDELGMVAYRKQRAMLALMVAMARADGRLDESERGPLIEACRKVLRRPGEPAQETAAADLLRVPDAAEMEELFDVEDRELVGRKPLQGHGGPTPMPRPRRGLSSIAFA